ncbi:BTAD domain-containing putative transcriptional regulator [Cryobacterium sp. Y11]|uniref:AfsR/SARP family transcriptional regulator n=1 Tax=Cryobacterium sp. Y11 TaxID=2045016 RepID=UPI000CE41909
MTFTRPRQDNDFKMSVKIIGALTIHRGNTVLHAQDLGGSKPRQILEILLLNFGRPVSKSSLIDLLWRDSPPQKAVASVESYVSVLRQHLQPGNGRFGPLRTTTGGYLIDSSTVDLDLARFDSLVREAQRVGADAAYPLLMDALALATVPLLTDELTPVWAEEERRRHAAVVTNARVYASALAATIGRIDESIFWANQALRDDPLNETAWTAVILGFEKDGQLAEGLREFARYRSMLDRELGCAPSATLREAHSRMLMATANSYSDLSDAVTALLVLNERLLSIAGGNVRTHEAPEGSYARAAVRAAKQVLFSFLRRVNETA